MTYFRKMLKY